MKNEKIKFENEIELLKKEIQELEGKIEEIPKSSFEDRTKTEALNFPTQVDSQADICFDFERKIRLPLWDLLWNEYDSVLYFLLPKIFIFAM